MTTKYLVVIETGSGEYGPKVGWDALWDSRADAEACAKRARKMDGWEARVVQVPAPHVTRRTECAPKETL